MTDKEMTLSLSVICFTSLRKIPGIRAHVILRSCGNAGFAASAAVAAASAARNGWNSQRVGRDVELARELRLCMINCGVSSRNCETRSFSRRSTSRSTPSSPHRSKPPTRSQPPAPLTPRSPRSPHGDDAQAPWDSPAWSLLTGDSARSGHLDSPIVTSVMVMASDSKATSFIHQAGCVVRGRWSDF
jgi:hypothetical protein